MLHLFTFESALSTGGDVIVVIGGDDNYKSDDEKNREVISRWAKRKVSSQFSGEYVDGRKSFIFSWNKQHRPIHEQALFHHFDPNKKGQQFEHRPPPTNPPSRTEPKSRANLREKENLHTLKHSQQSDEAISAVKTIREMQTGTQRSRETEISSRRDSFGEIPSSTSRETKGEGRP